MDVIPIQVTEDGVIIPRSYLGAAEEFEIVLEDEYVLVRPKSNGYAASEESSSEATRFPWIGIATTKDPTASQRVEEILESEIDRRAGWTLDR